MSLCHQRQQYERHLPQLFVHGLEVGVVLALVGRHISDNCLRPRLFSGELVRDLLDLVLLAALRVTACLDAAT